MRKTNFRTIKMFISKITSKKVIIYKKKRLRGKQEVAVIKVFNKIDTRTKIKKGKNTLRIETRAKIEREKIILKIDTKIKIEREKIILRIIGRRDKIINISLGNIEIKNPIKIAIIIEIIMKIRDIPQSIDKRDKIRGTNQGTIKIRMETKILIKREVIMIMKSKLYQERMVVTQELKKCLIKTQKENIEMIEGRAIIKIEIQDPDIKVIIEMKIRAMEEVIKAKTKATTIIIMEINIKVKVKIIIKIDTLMGKEKIISHI